MIFFEKPLQLKDVLTSLGEASRRAARWKELYGKHSIPAKSEQVTVD